MPEWNYILEENFSFLTHRVTGEHIHVDALNGPDVIESLLFCDFLVKHQRPGPAERRLLELFPNGQGLSLSLNRLLEENLFHLIDQVEIDVMGFELCHVVDKYIRAVKKFVKAWAAGPTPALAAVIGDWEVVHQLASDTGQSQLADRAAEQARRVHRRWQNLIQFEAGGGLYDELLYALAHAEVGELSEWLTLALEDPNVATTAEEIMGGTPG